ncbi:MAG: UDP-glucose 4-epimerase GalE [Puniceicoccales bacterium]|jgi:UDP-glucose 4-epimerase|nr:UDP-glucose 4-epimerase GalE [Puniceicoccales bacterium]
MSGKILVFGGAGYIGSHVVKCLLGNCYEPIVVDNLSFGHRQAVLTDEFEQADLLNVKSIDRVFDKHKIDAVIHLAAFIQVGESVANPAKYYRNNVVGTLNLLDSMVRHGVKKIVFSSTAALFGSPQYTPIDEAHPKNPINPYGQSKLMIERIFEDYHKAYGLSHIALRYFNASGADKDGQIGESHNPETHLIPLVLKAINGERGNVKIFGSDYDTPDGTCLRDYIHVEDLAEAHRLAIEATDRFSGGLNLGTSIPTSVKEIIGAAEKITGKKCPVEYALRREGDPSKLYASNEKAKEILHWAPKYTDIERIIQTAWNWEKNKKF